MTSTSIPGKSARVPLTISGEDRKIIQRAADALDLPLATFIRNAAARLLAEGGTATLPTPQGKREPYELRLRPEQKESFTQVAAAWGMSLNAFLVGAALFEAQALDRVSRRV